MKLRIVPTDLNDGLEGFGGNMETIEQRLLKLKDLGAGDEQCADCLHSQAPNMNGINVCKKCIADTPAFTALVNGLMAHASRLPSNA